MEPKPVLVRVLWLALAVALAVLCGTVTGWLAWADGASPAGAVRAGGGSFAGALALAVLLLTAARAL